MLEVQKVDAGLAPDDEVGASFDQGTRHELHRPLLIGPHGWLQRLARGTLHPLPGGLLTQRPSSL